MWAILVRCFAYLANSKVSKYRNEDHVTITSFELFLSNFIIGPVLSTIENHLKWPIMFKNEPLTSHSVQNWIKIVIDWAEVN